MVAEDYSSGIADSFDFLRRFELNVPKNYLETIVCHRGYHDPSGSLHRPAENTPKAFANVWRCDDGLVMCECDVTTTKDGVVVISHDSNFERLALIKDKLSKQLIENTLFKEYENKLRLKGDSKILSLDDLFDMLEKHSEKSRLIIEVKESADASKISEFLLKHRKTLRKVPVVMSFSREICFELQETMRHICETKVLLLTEMNPKDRNQLCQCLIHDKLSYPNLDLTLTECFDTVLNLEKSVDGNHKLDGMYFQFQEEMIEEGSVVRENIKKLSERCLIGVWLSHKDVSFDRLSTVQKLKEVGVKYVNTDIPATFFLRR